MESIWPVTELSEQKQGPQFRSSVRKVLLQSEAGFLHIILAPPFTARLIRSRPVFLRPMAELLSQTTALVQPETEPHRPNTVPSDQFAGLLHSATGPYWPEMTYTIFDHLLQRIFLKSDTRIKFSG